MRSFSSDKLALLILALGMAVPADATELLVLSQQSLDTLVAAAPDSRIDVRRFRPNLLVDVEAAQGFPAVLERLGRIGYAGVEPAGLHGLSPKEFRRCVEDAGMVVSSAHTDLPRGENANAILDVQEAIGNRLLVLPFLPHHWEFAKRVDERSALAFLFEQLDPEIFAELDVYWTRVGGEDPARVVSELGGKVRLVHVKDGPADDPAAPMTAVGDGALDIPAILGASHSAEWHIVELDRCATDMCEAGERSYGYLTGQGLARGRT